MTAADERADVEDAEEPVGCTPSGLALIGVACGIVGLFGLWSALGPVQWGDGPARARRAAAQKKLADIGVAIELYHADTGSWPRTVDDLLVEPPGVTGWNGRGYLKREPGLDPWMTAYRLEPTKAPSGEPACEPVSAGPDGVFGTEDDIRER